MAWSMALAELRELLVTFYDAELRIDSAFTAAVEPFGFHGVEPEVLQFHPDRAEWHLRWRLPLPDRLAPYEYLHCLVSLRETTLAPGGHGRLLNDRVVSGCIGVERYAGGGETQFDQVWGSVGDPIDSPAAATVAIRRVCDDLALHLGCVDLRPYLAGE